MEGTLRHVVKETAAVILSLPLLELERMAVVEEPPFPFLLR